MATRVRLDRKARTAIWVLVGLALAIVALVARNAVISLTPQRLAALESGSTSDELLVIGGHSVLLKQGSATDRISHSSHDGNNGRAFEIGDRSFAPNSDQLTSEGSTRAVQISQLMVHVPSLAARIEPLADDHGGAFSREGCSASEPISSRMESRPLASPCPILEEHSTRPGLPIRPS